MKPTDNDYYKEILTSRLQRYEILYIIAKLNHELEAADNEAWFNGTSLTPKQAVEYEFKQAIIRKLSNSLC